MASCREGDKERLYSSRKRKVKGRHNQMDSSTKGMHFIVSKIGSDAVCI